LVGQRFNVYDASGRLLEGHGVHASDHEKDGADEISVAGLSGLLADDQHVLDAEVLAAAGVNSGITSMTGLDDDGIPVVKVADAMDKTAPVLEGDLDGGGNYLVDVQNIPDLASKGEGYWFDGVDNYIDYGNDPKLDLGVSDATFMVLLKHKTAISASGSRFLTWYDNIGGLNGYVLRVDTSEYLRAYIALGGVTKTVTASKTPMNDNQNHWIAFVVDRDSATGLKFIVDGLEETYSTQDNPVDLDGENIVSISTHRIGAGSSGFEANTYFNGSIFTVLRFNLALTATEVKAFSSGAPIPYKYIGASQTALYESDYSVTADGTENTRMDVDANIDIGGETDTLRGTLVDGNSSHYFRIDNTAMGFYPFGKAVRINFDIYIPSENTKVDSFEIRIGGISKGVQTPIVDTWTSYSSEGVFATNITQILIFAADGATTTIDQDGDLVYIKNVVVTQIGCVLQLEQDSIGHNQWLDKSGNNLNGTVSGALPMNLPVNHREKFIETTTGDTSFTLPAGYLISSIILDSDGAIGGGIDVGTTNGGGEIVTAEAVSGAGKVLCTLVAGANYNLTGADDTIYITDADGTGWDGATVTVTVQMERIEL